MPVWILLLIGVASMAAGLAIMLSGLDLSARKEGRPPRIDATRLALGGLIDAGGVVAILFAVLRG